VRGRLGFGRSNQTRISSSPVKKLKILISIVPIVLLASVSISAPTPPPSFGTLPKNYQTMVRGYYSLPGRLLDPMSAVFRFETPRKGMSQDGIFVGHKKHYGWVIPVWINAKNAFGGYTGAQLYHVMYSAKDDTYADITELFSLGRVKFLP